MNLIIEKLQNDLDSMNLGGMCEITIIDSAGITIASDRFEPEFLCLDTEKGEVSILSDDGFKNYTIPFSSVECCKYDEEINAYVFKANGNDYLLSLW